MMGRSSGKSRLRSSWDQSVAAFLCSCSLLSKSLIHHPYPLHLLLRLTCQFLLSTSCAKCMFMKFLSYYLQCEPSLPPCLTPLGFHPPRSAWGAGHLTECGRVFSGLLYLNLVAVSGPGAIFHWHLAQMPVSISEIAQCHMPCFFCSLRELFLPPESLGVINFKSFLHSKIKILCLC